MFSRCLDDSQNCYSYFTCKRIDLILFHIKPNEIAFFFYKLSSCFENVWGDLTQKCDVLKIATKFTNEYSLK